MRTFLCTYRVEFISKSYRPEHYPGEAFERILAFDLFEQEEARMANGEGTEGVSVGDPTVREVIHIDDNLRDYVVEQPAAFDAATYRCEDPKCAAFGQQLNRLPEAERLQHYLTDALGIRQYEGPWNIISLAVRDTAA